MLALSMMHARHVHPWQNRYFHDHEKPCNLLFTMCLISAQITREPHYTAAVPTVSTVPVPIPITKG